MKFLFCAFIVFVSINGILAQYDSSEEDDDPRGYGYTSTSIILKKIEGLLGTLDHFRNTMLRGAPEKAHKFFSEVDVMKIFSEKIQELEAQLQEELQKNSNQVCNEVFEKKKVQVKEELQDFAFWVYDTIKMISKATYLMEKTLKRMTERVNRYSAEAGDCRVEDNAQCELLAKYHKDLYDVHSANIQEIRRELGELDVNDNSPAKMTEEMNQLITEKITKPVKECLSCSA